MSVAEQIEFRRPARLMGSAFEFIVIDDAATAERRLQEAVDEVKRIEYMLTEFSDTSQTAKINSNAGVSPTNVGREVFNLVSRCKRIYELTQGAFDITAAPLKKLYNFKGKQFMFPTERHVADTLKLVGSDKLKTIPPDSVFLTHRQMRISFAGIGKGYAADSTKSLLQSKGVMHGVVNASGDLTAWGHRADGKPWQVGIADPNDREKIIAWIPIQNASVATSGDYEQYFNHNGKRYAHTLDPKTGYPVADIKSVTVVSPSAELSDALATAVFVMGQNAGIDFIEQLPNVHALMITTQNKLVATSHLKFKLARA
jgi:FAD:protein FMN transferase